MSITAVVVDTDDLFAIDVEFGTAPEAMVEVNWPSIEIGVPGLTADLSGLVAKSGDQMTGNLGIGVPNDYPIQVGNGSTWNFAMDHWGTEQDKYADTPYDAAWAYYGRARGTNAAIAPVQNGDAIGGIAWLAADGTLPYPNLCNATIDGFVDGAVSAGVVPTAIKFNTGSIANAPVERLRIASDGTIYIGTLSKTIFDEFGSCRISNNDIAPSTTYTQAPWYWSNNEAWLAGAGNFGVSFLVQDTVLAGHTGHRETAHIRVYGANGILDNAYVALQTGATNTGGGSGQYFGLGSAAAIGVGTAATSEAVAAEFNTTVLTAVGRKAGLQIIDVGSTQNAADGFDHAIIIHSNGGTGYRYGLDIRADGLVAGTGIPIRIPNNTSIYARNAADNANIALIGLTSSNLGVLFPAGAPAFFGGDITLQRSAIGTSVTATINNSGAGYAGLELFGDAVGWLLSKRMGADSPSHALQWYYNSGGYTLKMSLSNAAILNLASGGAYQINSVQVVGARDTGWTAMTGTANENTAYATSSVTLPQLAGRVMALQAALTAHGLIGT